MSCPTTRHTIRFALCCTASLASVLLLAACETSSSNSGRPKSSKSSGDPRNSSTKSPAQWTMIEDEDDDGTIREVIVEVDVVREGDDDDHDDDDQDDDNQIERGSQRQVIRRRMIMHGGPGMGAPGMGAPGMSQPFPGSAPQELPPAPAPVMLGVRMRELDPILATHLGLNPRQASVLEDVAEELNGHESGLRDHDVIVAVNGVAQAGPADIRKVLRTKNPGDTIVFTVVRPSGKSDVTVKLHAWDHAKFMSATPARIGG